MGGIEVGRLAGVDHRAAAEGDVTVEIALTGEGRGRQEGLVAGLDAGADGYIAKPFSPIKLLDEIEKYLG